MKGYIVKVKNESDSFLFKTKKDRDSFIKDLKERGIEYIFTTTKINVEDK